MQIGNVAVYLPHVLQVLFVELAGRPLGEGDVEQYLVEADNEPVLVALVEDVEDKGQDDGANAEEAPEPRVDALRIEGDEKDYGRRPQANVREDVHHGVEHDGRHGAVGADMARKFHHTVRAAAEAERRRVAEGKARHGQFVGVAEREVLVVRAAVDDKLEGPGVAGVDHDPHAHDERHVGYDAGQLVLEHAVVHVERAEHDNNGGDAEKQEEISIQWLHTCRDGRAVGGKVFRGAHAYI